MCSYPSLYIMRASSEGSDKTACAQACPGFIQASLSKIQGIFKDF